MMMVMVHCKIPSNWAIQISRPIEFTIRGSRHIYATGGRSVGELGYRSTASGPSIFSENEEWGEATALVEWIVMNSAACSIKFIHISANAPKAFDKQKFDSGNWRVMEATVQWLGLGGLAGVGRYVSAKSIQLMQYKGQKGGRRANEFGIINKTFDIL